MSVLLRYRRRANWLRLLWAKPPRARRIAWMWRHGQWMAEQLEQDKRRARHIARLWQQEAARQLAQDIGG